MNSIGDRIRNLRKANDMSLEELAKYVGTSRQTIHRYETGVISNIPSDKIELMAEALHTTPDIIMGWATPDSERVPPTKESTEDLLYKVLVHYGILSEGEPLTDDLIKLIIPTIRALTDATRKGD